MSKRDHLLLIQDMAEAVEKILRYTNNLDYNGFIENDMTVDAVIRNFEIIGEAANRIDPDFKTIQPQIEWNRIRGFRNRLVHHYFGIDHEIVWSIITEDLQELQFQLREILK